MGMCDYLLHDGVKYETKNLERNGGSYEVVPCMIGNNLKPLLFVKWKNPDLYDRPNEWCIYWLTGTITCTPINSKGSVCFKFDKGELIDVNKFKDNLRTVDNISIPLTYEEELHYLRNSEKLSQELIVSISMERKREKESYEKEIERLNSKINQLESIIGYESFGAEMRDGRL